MTLSIVEQMSEAIYVCPKPNSTEIYGLTRATAEYAKDSTALMSLILMARDIARNLLLDKFTLIQGYSQNLKHLNYYESHEGISFVKNRVIIFFILKSSNLHIHKVGADAIIFVFFTSCLLLNSKQKMKPLI